MLKRASGIDLTTGALMLGGACLVVVSIVAAVFLLVPATPALPAQPSPIVVATPERASVALPSDRVAAVLNVDSAAGAGSAACVGDHVDVLGYFSRQVTGGDAVTRVLVADVPVLTVDRSASGVALTLAVRQESALLLQQAQALGTRPFVTLRSATQAADLPTTFSDSDLLVRLTGTP